MMLAQKYNPSPNWWLKNISEEQYRSIYAGTDAMSIIELFRTPPESDEEYFNEYFPSKMFRLNSGIYEIENKKGKKVKFEMNYAQHFVYAASLRHSRIIVLKSRQQGISTLWLLSYIDDAITNESFSIGLMSQGKKESQTLLERTTVALMGLPEKVVELLGITVVKDNSEAIAFSNGSKMYIQTSFRSGTLQRLHISEMGKISAKYPEKAKETKAGSLQAIAPGNTVVVESTAEGRKNEFYNMWHEAASYVGNRTPMDFYPVFLSWTDDPDCNLDIPQTIDAEAQEYFIKCELHVAKYSGVVGFKLTQTQKWWWVAKKREIPMEIYQEYPATPDEAFAAVRDGTYYARIYKEKVLDRGQLREDLYDPKLPVYASADLGRNDMWVTVYFQVHRGLSGRREWRVIASYNNSGEAIAHYVNESKTRPWLVKRWFLPHDADVTDLSQDKSRVDIFRALGCKCKVIRKASDVVNDIEVVRSALPDFWLDPVLASYIIDMFYNYTKEWDSKGDGAWKTRPLHDEWSNPADAIRYMIMGFTSGHGDGSEGNNSSKKGKRRRRSASRGGAVAV